MTNPASTGTQIAGGAAWMIALRLGVRGLGFISTIFLARLLVPADFGLVAMALTVGSVLDRLLDPNFGTALISEPSNDRRHYDTAWTLSIIKGGFIGLVLVLSAGVIADYFHDHRLVAIIHIYALTAVLSGFQNIGTVKFVKEFQMQRSFALGIAAKLLSFGVTITAAFTFRNYWALVIGGLVQCCATLALSYVLCDFRPRLCLDKSGALFRFSWWLMANNVFWAVVSQMDAIVMGRLATARALGIYRIALEISALPATEIMVPARQALFAGFVKWADDREKLSQNYVESLAVMISIALPVAAGLAIVAEPLTRVLLGDQWLDAVPIIRILLFSAIVQILCDNASAALNAMRQPHINMMMSAAIGPIYVVALYFGVLHYGVVGAAVAHASWALLYLIANSFILRRFLKTSLLAVFRLSWRTILATAVMAITVPQLAALLVDPSVTTPFAELALLIGLGLGIFAGIEGVSWAVFGLGGGAEARIAGLIFSFLRQRPSFSRSAP